MNNCCKRCPATQFLVTCQRCKNYALCVTCDNTSEDGLRFIEVEEDVDIYVCSRCAKRASKESKEKTMIVEKNLEVK
jgi:hypothetical protein